MKIHQLRAFSEKVLTLSSLGNHIKTAEYAVRGDVVIRAMEIEKELKQGVKYPFTELTACNIGNPQYLGQRHLTWIRQGLSLLVNPDLLSMKEVVNSYPADIIRRCEHLLLRVKGGVGAYSESQGLGVVRETVARYIENRDQVGKADPDDIFLTNGASPSVELALTVAISKKTDGIMIPIPQYPLYNALITLKEGTPLGYYMDSSEDSWQLSIPEMEKTIEQAKRNQITPKAIVIINPGNPTGQVFSKDNMQRVVEFCEKHSLVLMADEVYQDNVYVPDKQFHSFRKVVHEMKLNTELFSFHSLSKGFYGECGIRGGYMELNNIDKEVRSQVLKLSSIMLCSTTLGQLAVELALNPPGPNDESYQLFMQEKDEILQSLKRKAKMMHDILNQMDNIQCNYVEGAMYAMPAVKFSEKAANEAQKRNMPVDKFYVMQALEETGIILVPGSGFGQKPGTHHFRITVLCPESSLRETMLKFKAFNDNFHKKYRD